MSTADPEESMRQLIDELDLPLPDPETNVCLLRDIDLIDRFNAIDEELKQLGQVLHPTTQQGRDLHSTRSAYLIEMKRRKLR